MPPSVLNSCRMFAMLGLLAAAQSAHAAAINFSTAGKSAGKYWTVSELSNFGAGAPTTAAPVFYNCCGVPYKVMTIPFSDNDGFWTADYYFTLPAGATAVKMTITAAGADDRFVANLNGAAIANGGGDSPGVGQMQLTDPGTLIPYTFTGAGQKIVVKSGFITGTNHIQLIVNNTNTGISGGLQGGGPTLVNFQGKVTYTPAAPARHHH